MIAVFNALSKRGIAVCDRERKCESPDVAPVVFDRILYEHIVESNRCRSIRTIMFLSDVSRCR